MIRKVGATMSAESLVQSIPAGDARYSEAQECGSRHGAASLRRWQIPALNVAAFPDAKAVVPARIGGT